MSVDSWDEFVPESRVLKYNEAGLQKQKELLKAHGYGDVGTSHKYKAMNEQTIWNMQPHCQACSSSPSKFVCARVCVCVFYKAVVPLRFLPWEIQVAFPKESQLQQSDAT